MKRRIFILILFCSFFLFNFGCVQPESSVASLEGNQSPLIQFISVDPLFIKVGATALITVDAVDPDGDAISFSWSTPLGDIIGSGAQVRYSAAYCCVGINSVTVIVEDSRGAKTSETFTIEIVP